MPAPTEVEKLRKLVGIGPTTTDGDLEDQLASAVELLTKYLTDNAVEVDDIPGSVLKRAIRAVAAEMVEQDEAPGGVVNQPFGDGGDGFSTAVRISADPLRPAYPLLGMWVAPVSFA